jgi:hypothetical protein
MCENSMYLSGSVRRLKLNPLQQDEQPYPDGGCQHRGNKHHQHRLGEHYTIPHSELLARRLLPDAPQRGGKANKPTYSTDQPSDDTTNCGVEKAVILSLTSVVVELPQAGDCLSTASRNVKKILQCQIVDMIAQLWADLSMAVDGPDLAAEITKT